MAADEAWIERSARAAKASHQLIGWIFWDPRGIAEYEAIGGPGNGPGYYVCTRAAPLAPAGADAVVAAFYSINADFIRMFIDAAPKSTTWEAITAARDRAVVAGLRECVPEVCDPLEQLAAELWGAADSLDPSGRVFFAAHRGQPRAADPLLSAWLALNCIREWRGDTHWALLVSDDINAAEAGLLHDAYMGYPGEWIPRSRGSADDEVSVAFERLEAKGLVTDGAVNPTGIERRELIERRTDELSAGAWQHLGASATDAFVELVEPLGGRIIDRIDATAGDLWMPAARDRRT